MGGEARESCSSRADRRSGLSFYSTGSYSLSVLMVAIVPRFAYMLMIDERGDTLHSDGFQR